MEFFMKKTMKLSLFTLMALGLAACGNSKTDSSDTSTSSSSDTVSVSVSDDSVEVSDKAGTSVNVYDTVDVEASDGEGNSANVNSEGINATDGTASVSVNEDGSISVNDGNGTSVNIGQ